MAGFMYALSVNLHGELRRQVGHTVGRGEDVSAVDERTPTSVLDLLFTFHCGGVHNRSDNGPLIRGSVQITVVW